MPYTLSDFHHIRPHHIMDQEKILDWVSEVHARAANRSENQDVTTFAKQMRQKLSELGVGKDHIQSRGIHISDPLQKQWEKMEIYPVVDFPNGHGFAKRFHFYDREVSRIFERFYPEDKVLPKHLIHVTCTGYVAPSPAQKIVSLRGAGAKTTVTHAYHMGCYGAIPAIRIGSGYSSLPSSTGLDSVDIVHTELCSLHLQPLRHNTAQLIIESLFGDGFIKYTVSSEPCRGTHLKVLALHEETIPNSTHCMSWNCDDNSLGMTLSKEVPVFISRTIEGYLKQLCEIAKTDLQTLMRKSFFAIHPGGPKIVRQIKDQLHLEPHQIEHSAFVLKHFGNMSSATLPHIWEKMLEDPKVPKKSWIVSMAFGPGLSVSGGLFEKGG